MKNKVTIEEPATQGEGPEWEVGALYECTSGAFAEVVYVADMNGSLVNLGSGGVWREGKRFADESHRFRRLPPGTKVTIEVPEEKP